MSARGPRLRTDTAWRVVDATAERVYRALTDPNAVAAWLPPGGMTGRVDAFDPRPGGAYRLTLRYRDAAAGQGKTSEDSDVVEGVFVELVPGARVVQRVAFGSDDPAFAGTMTVSWRLDPVAEGTRVTVACEDVPPGIRRKDHLAGLRSSLANLADFVERERP